MGRVHGNIAMVIVEVTNAINLGKLFLWAGGEGHNVRPDEPCDPADHTASQQCPLVLNPRMYAMAIGLKWIHFIFELLNTEGFGHSVLPAFKAVTGKDAMAFMLFLMIIVFGTVQTYWALPISQHLPKDGTGISVFELVFMKIFRLELLGDFDIPNLEGTHPVINGNWTGDRLRAEIGDPKESPLFHDAIMIIVLFASGVVTVLLMNVAIGVVSTAYSTNKHSANQLYCHFQAGYVFKLLLIRALFEKWCPKILACLQNLSDRVFWCECCKRARQSDVSTGYFIGFDGRWFMDSNDIDEDFEELQGTISENWHKLDKIHGLLKNGSQDLDIKNIASLKPKRKKGRK